MKILFHRRCERDLLRLKRAGWSMVPFEQFLSDCARWPLPAGYSVHQLTGDLEEIWDIHIRENWVVFLKKGKSTITLLRTGTHTSLGIG